VDCVKILQNIIWVAAYGVVNEEYVIYVSGVKGQDFGVHEVFDGGFFKML